MDSRTRRIVRKRSGDRCEYCQIPQAATPFIRFHVEHIVAKQHVDDDQDDPARLAYSCDRCNAHKGTNLSSIDPATKERADLFDPRSDQWPEHFELSEGLIIGRTAVGRATARLLNMNDHRRIELRLQWLEERGL